MASEGSVTRWIGLLKEGDQAAAQPLWEAYFHRLVSLARTRLRATPCRVADEEDVALSAFDSFCRHAEQGRFPRLADRDDLWKVLFVLTVRKAIDLARREGRKSRGAGRLRSLEDLADLGDVLPDEEPTPELAAQLADECRRRLDLLGEGSLRSLAIFKMESYTNKEIAERLGIVEHSVERKLRRIRELWSGEAAT